MFFKKKFLPDFPVTVASTCQVQVQAAPKQLSKQSSGHNAVSFAFIRQAAAPGRSVQEFHDAGYVADSGYLHFLSAS